MEYNFIVNMFRYVNIDTIFIDPIKLKNLILEERKY